MFGSRGGWERPNWFAPKGTEAKDKPDFDRAKTNWFAHVGEEHKAVRERVALIDQTSFSKFELMGEGVVPFLQRMAVSNMDRPVGSVIYTQLCNDRGGIECDLTFTRVAQDRYYFVTGAAFGKHDAHWIQSHLRRDGTGAAGRRHLGARRHQPVRAEGARGAAAGGGGGCLQRGFPVRDHARDHGRRGAGARHPHRLCRRAGLGIARADRICRRMSTNCCARRAKPHGIADVGYRAIDSLRMEKGYLYWSSDITPDYSPLEAGLGFRVNFNKGDFIGRDALLKQRDAGVKQRLVTFLLDEYLPLYGSEAVMVDGKVVGVTTGGNFGYTAGKAIGYGYLPVELVERGEVEIEAFGKVSQGEDRDQGGLRSGKSAAEGVRSAA